MTSKKFNLETHGKRKFGIPIETRRIENLSKEPIESKATNRILWHP